MAGRTPTIANRAITITSSPLADRFDGARRRRGRRRLGHQPGTPGKVILGSLDGVEAGVRQMIRKVPLEMIEVELPSAGKVTVPTLEETLRIKAFLVVRRNQTRDYLDLAALSEHLGSDRAAAVLARIDDYYADQREDGDGVASQLVRQLSDPRPADRSVTGQLSSYRRLRRRWSDWSTVTAILGEVAARMVSS